MVTNLLHFSILEMLLYNRLNTVKIIFERTIVDIKFRGTKICEIDELIKVERVEAILVEISRC